VVDCVLICEEDEDGSIWRFSKTFDRLARLCLFFFGEYIVIRRKEGPDEDKLVDLDVERRKTEDR
jgi:hypothetical protein